MRTSVSGGTALEKHNFLGSDRLDQAHTVHASESLSPAPRARVSRSSYEIRKKRHVETP